MTRAREFLMIPIELTWEEKALLDRIDFDPSPHDQHDPTYWNRVARLIAHALIL